MRLSGDPADDMRLALCFLRGEYGHFASCNYKQWMSLCRQLSQSGLLACCVPDLEKLAPKPVMVQVAAFVKAHREVMLRRMDALRKFSTIAEREHLRFALIKGMAAARELYGGEFSRQSGDIDVLVAADDIPRADYVARQAGWLQFAEAHRVRCVLNEGGDHDAISDSARLPFPLRSSPHLPHVTNYFYLHNSGQVDSLEVHDRFHGIHAANAAALLTDVRAIKLGGRRYSVLSRPSQALLSMLSLHEDAEGVRANTMRMGDLGLKACVDTARWLEVLGDDEIKALGKLVRELGCDDPVSRALGVCCELFPSSAERALMVASPKKSVWPTPYEQRLLNPETAAMAGGQHALSAALARLVSGHPAAVFSDGGWHCLPAYSSHLVSGFSFRFHRGCGTMLLVWSAPAAFALPEEDVAFQVILVGADPSGYTLALHVDALCCKGEWRATLGKVTADTFEAHVGLASNGCELHATAMPDGSGGLKVEVSIEERLLPNAELRPLPSVHARTCASMFAVRAGWMLVDVVEEALGV